MWVAKGSNVPTKAPEDTSPSQAALWATRWFVIVLAGATVVAVVLIVINLTGRPRAEPAVANAEKRAPASDRRQSTTRRRDSGRRVARSEGRSDARSLFPPGSLSELEIGHALALVKTALRLGESSGILALDDSESDLFEEWRVRIDFLGKYRNVLLSPINSSGSTRRFHISLDGVSTEGMIEMKRTGDRWKIVGCTRK